MDAIHLSGLVPLEMAAPLFGYVVPPVAVLVLLMNVLLTITLCRRHMRSPINALMVGISTLDTLAITVPVPMFLYFYSAGKFHQYVPFSLCRIYFTTAYIVPLMCNMASLWLTVALAFTRCISVWRPLAARALITWYRTNLVVLIIVLISVGVFFPSLFEYNFDAIKVPLNETENTIDINVAGCRVEKSFVHLNKTFCEAHTWVQIMLTSLIPWFCILFPEVGLLWRLKKAEIQRNSLMSEKDTTDHNRKRDIGEKMSSINQHLKLKKRRHMITLMIFINVTVIWLIEIPFAVVFTRLMLQNQLDFMRSNIGHDGVVVILAKYITYPMIFVSYCVMSGRFRKTFKDVILCRATGAMKLLVNRKSGSTRSSVADDMLLKIKQSRPRTDRTRSF